MSVALSYEKGIVFRPPRFLLLLPPQSHAKMLADFLDAKIEERRLFLEAVRRPLIDGVPHPAVAACKMLVLDFIAELDEITAAHAKERTVRKRRRIR